MKPFDYNGDGKADWVDLAEAAMLESKRKEKKQEDFSIKKGEPNKKQRIKNIMECIIFAVIFVWFAWALLYGSLEF